MQGGDYELINLQGKISGGKRGGSGSELSIWDYPDLMEGIKQPMGGNPLSIRADFRHIDVRCCAGRTLRRCGRGLGSGAVPLEGGIPSFTTKEYHSYNSGLRD